MATNDKDDTVKVIAKLITLTQKGELKWTAGSLRGDARDRDGFEISFVFEATYMARSLRLYEYRRRVDDPGPFGLFGNLNSITATGLQYKTPTYPYWENGVKLELCDEYGRSLWSFPSHSSISDLLRAVRFQVAGVKDFLDNALKDQ